MIGTYIIVALVMMLIVAFFAGSEIAFLASSLVKIELRTRQGSRSAKILSYFKKNISKLLITILIANTIAIVVYTRAMDEILGQFMPHEWLEHNHLLSKLIVSLVATVILLVLAEFIPKAIFRRNADRIIYPSAYMLQFAYWVLWVPVQITNFLSKLFLRLVGVKVEDQVIGIERQDLDHYIMEVINASEGNPMPELDSELLTNALEFADTKVREFMVPRTKIVSIDASASIEELMNLFLETKLSKIIVCKESLDEIEGFVHTSAMFRKPKTIKEVLQPVLVVPEIMQAKVLMTDFTERRRSVAIVVDEFGGTAGLVTMEDLLEEVVGDIDDEHDNEEGGQEEEDYVLEQKENGVVIIGASREIYNLNEELGLNLPESDDYNTIGGLIMHQEERIPATNEKIKVGKYDFTILKATHNRVICVRLESNRGE